MELPLLDIFQQLRRREFPLGIDDYTAMLRCLQAGYGVGELEDAALLCCLLWSKSREENQIVRRLLAQTVSSPPAIAQETHDRQQRHPAGQDAGVRGEDGPSSEGRSGLWSWSHTYMSGFVPSEDAPVQVVQAIRQGAQDDATLGWPRRDLLTEYFPITRRQMKQEWRHLRRIVRVGPRVELDLDTTILKIAREGILLEPVLVPRQSNAAKVVLLIDRDGSMVPFHALSEQVALTAALGGRLRATGSYYFHDYPDRYLYGDPFRLNAQLITDILKSVDRQTSVLVVSDAGAARGNFDPERITHTSEFVHQLTMSVRYYAWLNPMPRSRWAGTSADEIAHQVPMFEMSRRGLRAAISTLRGQYRHPRM